MTDDANVDEHKNRMTPKEKIIEFANYLNDSIPNMLFNYKIPSQIIMGILEQHKINVHRTMEVNKEVQANSIEEWVGK